MNANKLFKLLENGQDSFNRLPQYKQILEQSSRVVVDFSQFKALDVFSKRAAETARDNGIASPFDNILLDLPGIEAPSISNSATIKQDLLLHLIPIQLATDVSTFSVMLVQDLRVMRKDVYPRSHLVSLSKNELASMPVVDAGMAELGCKCSIKNPFSHNPIFKQVQSFTPGFKADSGYAAFNCPSTLACCKQLRGGSDTITCIAMACMIYMTMPCHAILQVTDQGHRQRKGLKQMPYFILVDKNAVENLKNNKPIGQLAFNDGNDFDKFNTTEKLVVDKFTINKIVYEQVTK
jgi:hypothetical protein